MSCQPSVLLDCANRQPWLSILLTDAGLLNSHHVLYYLNRQTLPRHRYEIIWLEYYSHRPRSLESLSSLLDRWIELGYSSQSPFHRHRLYNVGFLASRGKVCILLDARSIVSPGFLQAIVQFYLKKRHRVLHMDELASLDPIHFPFRYPTPEEVMATACEHSGLCLNRGHWNACMSAPRADIITLGGADEHEDYQGRTGGPHELGQRLSHYYNRRTIWHPSEQVYRVWSPELNPSVPGREDERGLACRAIVTGETGRLAPYIGSPLFEDPQSLEGDLDSILDSVYRFSSRTRNAGVAKLTTHKGPHLSASLPEEIVGKKWDLPTRE